MILHRPIITEVLVSCIIQAVLVGFIIPSTTCELHSELQLASWVAFVAFLLLPSNVSLFPPRIIWGKSFYEKAKALPRRKVAWSEATKSCGSATNEQYVVVGGSGFVGVRLVHALLIRGETRVRVIDMDDNGLNVLKQKYGDKLECVKADVTNPEQIERALEGAQCVFAPFAVIRFWEGLTKHVPRSFKVNVTGTQNVVDVCTKLGVSRLIATSSSAAIELFPGFESEGINEDSPLCSRENYLANYSLTKSLAEQIVTRANGQNGMATGAIRPCSTVYGFGDKLNLRITMESGKFLCISPSNKMDYVHVDDVVLAHLLLEKRLRNGPNDEAAGVAFCISGCEPVEEAVYGAALTLAAEKYGFKVSLVFMPSRILLLLSLIVSMFEYIYPWNSMDVLGKDLGSLTFTTFLTASHNLVVKNSVLPKKLLGYEPHMSVLTAIERTLEEYKKGELIME